MEYNKENPNTDFKDNFISKPKSVGIKLNLDKTNEKEYQEILYETVIPNLNKQTLLPHTIYLTKRMALRHLIRTGIKIQHVDQLIDGAHDLVLTTSDTDERKDKRWIEKSVRKYSLTETTSSTPVP